MTGFLQLCDGGRPAVECHTARYCKLGDVEYRHGYSRLSGERLWLVIGWRIVFQDCQHEIRSTLGLLWSS